MSTPFAFVLDEHFRGRLLLAVRRHNAQGLPHLDVTQVGDPPDLPRGTPDPEILLWAERNGRVLISRDRSSMFDHLADHLAAGRHSPGVIILKATTLPGMVADLEVLAYASLPGEWFDRIAYHP